MQFKDIYVYDVEINRLLQGKEWGSVDCSLFASAVVYSYSKDRFFFFLHVDSIDRLLSLLKDSLVISFNGVRFDSKVTLGKGRSVNSYDKTALTLSHGGVSWVEYDVFVQCLRAVNGKSSAIDSYKSFSPGGLKLQDIAKGTLGVGKSGLGSMAPTYYQRGEYDRLLEYNFNDVKLTKGIFEFAIRHGYLVGDRRVKVKIGGERFRNEYFKTLL